MGKQRSKNCGGVPLAWSHNALLLEVTNTGFRERSCLSLKYSGRIQSGPESFTGPDLDFMKEIEELARGFIETTEKTMALEKLWEENAKFSGKGQLDSEEDVVSKAQTKTSIHSNFSTLEPFKDLAMMPLGKSFYDVVKTALNLTATSVQDRSLEGFQYNLSLGDVLWNPNTVRAELESQFGFDDLRVEKLLSYTAPLTEMLMSNASYICNDVLKMFEKTLRLPQGSDDIDILAIYVCPGNGSEVMFKLSNQVQSLNESNDDLFLNIASNSTLLTFLYEISKEISSFQVWHNFQDKDQVFDFLSETFDLLWNFTKLLTEIQTLLKNKTFEIQENISSHLDTEIKPLMSGKNTSLLMEFFQDVISKLDSNLPDEQKKILQKLIETAALNFELFKQVQRSLDNFFTNIKPLYTENSELGMLADWWDTFENNLCSWNLTGLWLITRLFEQDELYDVEEMVHLLFDVVSLTERVAHENITEALTEVYAFALTQEEKMPVFTEEEFSNQVESLLMASTICKILQKHLHPADVLLLHKLQFTILNVLKIFSEEPVVTGNLFCVVTKCKDGLTSHLLLSVIEGITLVQDHYQIKIPSEIGNILNMLLDVVSSISSLLNKVNNVMENLPVFLQGIQNIDVLDISALQQFLQGGQFRSSAVGSLESVIKAVCKEESSFFSNINLFIDMPRITGDLEDNMAKYGIPEDTSPFCLKLYQEILQSSNGALLWTFLKPLLHGKILYNSNISMIDLVIEKANLTFRFVENLKTYSETWLRMSEVFKTSGNVLTVSRLQEALQSNFIKHFIESNLDIDMEKLFKEMQVYEMMMNEMFNSSASKQIDLLSQLVVNISSCVLLNRFQPFDSVEKLEEKAHELMRQNNFLAIAGMVRKLVYEREIHLEEVHHPCSRLCPGPLRLGISEESDLLVKTDAKEFSGIMCTSQWHNFQEKEPAPSSWKGPRMEGATIGVVLLSLTKEHMDGQKAAVKGLSLTFHRGQITALLGPNGAGKTTVISLLTGLYPPSSGTIIINGKDIRTDLAAIRTELGVCPQYDVLFNILTVREHLLLYGSVKAPGWTKEQLNQQVSGALEDVDLSQHQYKPVGALSGGMKRRLSIAISFIGNSKTVVLDEPTSGVDPCSRRSIWNVLLKYKSGCTLIFTTHHLDEAEVLSDRIAILQHGQLRCCGSPSYLRETYGQGHSLTLIKKPSVFEIQDPKHIVRVTSLVQTHIPEAFLKENSGTELTYVIPEMADKTSFKGISLMGASSVHGAHLVLTQIVALLMKRFRHAGRDWKGSLSNVLLPVLFVALAMALFSVKPLAIDYPSLKLTPRLYDNAESFFRYGGWSFGGRKTFELQDKKLSNTKAKPLAKVWYNQKGFHSLPSYLNELNNLVLWMSLPPNVDWRQYGITLYSQPYGGALLDEDKIMENVRQCGVALCIMLGFSVLTASIGSATVKDRVSGTKRLQHITGLGYKTYWLANFCCDMLLYMVPVTLCVAVISAFQLSAFTFRKNLAATGLLLILFGYATLPWMYLVSRFFSSSDVAFICYISLNFVFGLCTMLVTLLPRLLAIISKVQGSVFS
ncbi:hypothetical protein AV530_016136 [Patagioenas fasciata monilis]|uniref:ABC transporter domain-containing protein n=1 Tax=Patagioenas fasciata monilis TaxID=372326 RepID=A0A1V4JWJ6_PATFA|nr:hypothetical protein AV530_016136 [Patagioenas fasciata monilis]